jgi:hypothetical protein
MIVLHFDRGHLDLRLVKRYLGAAAAASLEATLPKYRAAARQQSLKARPKYSCGALKRPPGQLRRFQVKKGAVHSEHGVDIENERLLDLTKSDNCLLNCR